jgi:hypothetical protein
MLEARGVALIHPTHALHSAAKSTLTQNLFLDNDSLDQNTTWYSFSNVARVEMECIMVIIIGSTHSLVVKLDNEIYGAQQFQCARVRQ